jgi:rubrerythrin
MEQALCEVALTALEKAMETARKGRVFYAEAAEHVKDPMGKAVFQTLSRDQEEHLRLLQAEHEAISNDQDWMELEEAKVCEPLTPLKLYPEKQDAALMIAADATDLDALALAMKYEEQGYDMYVAAGAETDDPKGKKVFDFLATQANSHYAFLQKTHEYLTSEGAWYFDEQEFPMFDGG